MSKYRPDPLFLFYLPTREEAEIAFDALALVCGAITKAKNTKQARTKLRALLEAQGQPEQTRQFIERILDLKKDRMERYAQAALRRLFGHTAHYQSALNNRTEKARAKEQA